MTEIYTEFNSIYQERFSRLSDFISNYADRMDWSRRLAAAFEQTGWSKMELSRRSRVPYDSVNKYLSGKVDKPRGKTLGMLASALNVDPIWLEYGTDVASGETQVPLMGFLGAGAEVEPDYEQVPPEGLDQITIPFPLPDDMIAFRVRGDSMLPVFKDGAVIVVFREQKKPLESFYGEEAAVRTLDGRRFIKTIMRGADGSVSLLSWNAAPIENVRLEWIGEVFAVLPPAALKKAVRQGGIQGQLKLKSA